MESSRDVICAGGWNDSRKDYLYLQKETGSWVERKAPDVHVAVITATVTDENGKLLKGKGVTFNWDMPGPAPAISRTVTSDSNGIAKMDIISGDELSTDTDEKGTILFNNPVKVKLKCEGKETSRSLDIAAPNVEWQYKNEKGSYLPWNGELFGLYHDGSIDVPLRALFTFDRMPVSGHSIEWRISEIRNKGGVPVLPNNPTYSTYGSLSGPLSTTDKNGSATSTYMPRYNVGQLVFTIEDESVNTQDISSVAPRAIATTSNDEFDTSSEQPSNRFFAKARKKKNFARKTIRVLEYKWVVGPAKFSDSFAYPAPSGEESNELITPTMVEVLSKMPGKESTSFSRYQSTPYRILQNGDWWFSQVIGDDSESANYHFADFKIPVSYVDPITNQKHSYSLYYGAAFDVVLTKVPIFERGGRRAAFGPYVKAMRDMGIVAWHRWAGEDANHDGRAGASENEMHCIDPATPFIKTPLKTQVKAFIDNGELLGASGAPDYDLEPTDPRDPFFKFFHISRRQTDLADFRRTTKAEKFRRDYPTAIQVHWPSRT